MAENLNVLLAIIVAIITILSAFCGVLIFIWRTSGNLTGVLSSLNNGIARLNENLAKMEARADKTDETLGEHDDRLDDHETRLVVIEREVGIVPVTKISDVS